ncbi:hypothetical protein ACPUEJ_16425 [Vibrio tubiashii]|uniref:hypothetical protein n=1 Tax=Vibrio tubiashii TaxID=29498 RepID=UPI003CE56EF8
MRCKCLISMLSLVACSVSASDIWEAHLKADMEQSYQALDDKVELCLSQRNSFQYRGEIQNVWFNNLTDENKKGVLLFAFERAMERCSMAERAEYTRIMLRYVSFTNDDEPLEQWKKLVRGFPDVIDSVVEVGIEDAENFSDTHFSQPFDVLQVAKSLSL